MLNYIKNQFVYLKTDETDIDTSFQIEIIELKKKFNLL